MSRLKRRKVNPFPGDHRTNPYFLCIFRPRHSLWKHAAFPAPKSPLQAMSKSGIYKKNYAKRSLSHIVLPTIIQ